MNGGSVWGTQLHSSNLTEPGAYKSIVKATIDDNVTNLSDASIVQLVLTHHQLKHNINQDRFMKID